MVAVLFDEDFSVERAARLTWDQVDRISKYNAHLNGNVIFVNDALRNTEGHEDVTRQLRKIQATI